MKYRVYADDIQERKARIQTIKANKETLLETMKTLDSFIETKHQELDLIAVVKS